MTEWESIGPFRDYRLVVEGWSVPLLSARELDGGKVSITLDSRINLVCQSIEEANRVIPFLADVVGAALGYGAHPRSDEWYAEAGLDNPWCEPGAFAAVPHPSLAPHRVKEIVATEEGPNRGEDE